MITPTSDVSCSCDVKIFFDNLDKTIKCKEINMDINYFNYILFASREKYFILWKTTHIPI